eukprot:TRINITY_DN12156_c0_g1_i1.p1 TRINITY_DN12156_c0_g1~~TRINITY_DN12156_c0_g1_i1.p1  ORF type:complete len:152 (+),score=9.76 TRINITY_DN12156_c0_g1_i1:71-526(+)
MKVLLLTLFLFVAVTYASSPSFCVLSECAKPFIECHNSTDCRALMSHADSCKDLSCQQNLLANPIAHELMTCSAKCAANSVTDTFSALYPTSFGPSNGCSVWTMAGCAVAVAGAIAACGGPEDVPCILAILGGLTQCGRCFCQQIQCKCPC